MPSDDATGQDGWMTKAVSWTKWTLRFVRAHALISHARNQAITTTLGILHHDVVHQVRRLAAAMETSSDFQVHTQIASNLCDKFHDAMAKLLEHQPNQLHCCIKLVAPKAKANEDDRIGTWVRSQPHDGRPIESDPAKDFHDIKKNSVWCAFYGLSDGATIWQPTNCFCCNDLLKRGQTFKCDRENWQNYYRSNLVFPINYARNAEGTEFSRIGFLAFDSPKAGAFRKIPDIYDYRENLTGFKDVLSQRATFHLGAIFADLLGAAVGPVYDPNPVQGRMTNAIPSESGVKLIDGRNPDNHN